MRICLIGAGAIGGYLAVRLIKGGAHVNLIVRGANLEAIRRNGLTLINADGTQETAMPALATNNPAEAGPQDVVIVAVKAQQLPALLPTLLPLLGPDTAVVPAQNGIPWWYFQRYDGAHAGYQVRAVDPEGALAAAIAPERVIGCVVYPAAELLEPGVIRHIEHNRFTLGEPDGTKSERVRALSQIFTQADLKAPVRPDIRNEIWLKLWGNATFNPLSALTRATLVAMCTDPQMRDLVRAMMAEVQAVASAFGVRFPISIEQRIDAAEKVGAHKTSMLQDIEAGRATEVDALSGAVAELGRLVGVPTPHLDTVYACVKLLERRA